MPVDHDAITLDYALYVTSNPGEALRLVGLAHQLAYGRGDLTNPEAPVHVVSGALLISPAGEILLTPVGGRWAFPGGHVDPADPDLLGTARRHLCEVTQLPAAAFTLPARQDVVPCDYDDEEQTYPDGRQHLHRVFLFGFRLSHDTAERSLRLLGERVSDFRWTPVSSFREDKDRLHAKLLRMVAA